MFNITCFVKFRNRPFSYVALVRKKSPDNSNVKMSKQAWLAQGSFIEHWLVFVCNVFVYLISLYLNAEVSPAFSVKCVLLFANFQ